MGLTVIADGGNIDVNTSTKVLSTVPSGWDEQVAEYGRGYNYPQPTGQTVVYRTGDDADIEATIFAPVRVDNSLKVQNSLINFLTLGNTNSFGNTLRFTDELGTEIFANNYKIDNYTGIGWYMIPISVNTNWDACIDAPLALNTAGFSDYFLCNKNQYSSILNQSLTSRPYYDVIPTVLNYSPYTSTTLTPSFSVYAFQGAYQYGTINIILKTSASRMAFACRKHF